MNGSSLPGTADRTGQDEAGLTVRLLDGAGQPLAALTVRSGAPYSFTGLPAGQYQLECASAGADPGDRSAGFRSAVFTLASGGTVTHRAATIDCPGTVIGSAHPDAEDSGEGAGAPGATIRLLSAAGATVATTTTGAGGSYAFQGIAPGTYQIGFPAGDSRDGAAPLRSASFAVPPAGSEARQPRAGRMARAADKSQPIRRRSAGAIRRVASAPTISP
ncbi:MSCRAMM family protein [Roseomonas populi]|uniref:Carboxypeptidase regulatory-like domain-containing protein n=1 Tax=Roseomonas populi TaxID=3121582 RepID=A0ABT1X600_9PROT|nr:SdrD B-like domain-containing protein [Roseomonas pecuniae]MCR0982414.1 carboxypeptidase regulatory-like domain-containing protein [Roseomonas pecuniae]